MQTQRTLVEISLTPGLVRWVEGFFVAKRAKGMARRTVDFYQARLTEFVSFCEKRNVSTLEAIDPGLLREFIISLTAGGHNPGGVHTYYRVLKTFFRWYETETEPDGWRNPMRKVEAPRVPEQILEPVEMNNVKKLLATCDGGLVGLRDRAILLTLLDTGARASEMLAFDVDDLDQVTGDLLIRRGKGGKARTVFLGKKSRRAVRAYLKARGEAAGPLFATREGARLVYWTLRAVVERRAELAGISPPPSLHSFRRACTINLLRSGADLLTIQRLLGHADMSLLKRYAKQNVDDLREVHARHSPADNAGW